MGFYQKWVQPLINSLKTTILKAILVDQSDLYHYTSRDKETPIEKGR